MLPENDSFDLPWACLNERLLYMSLMPYDVGSSGDCFLGQFQTNCMELQSCIFRLVPQELGTWIIIQNFILRVFLTIVGKTTSSKSQDKEHGVIVSLFRQSLMLIIVFTYSYH